MLSNLLPTAYMLTWYMGTYTFEPQIHCRLVRLGYLAFTQATRVQIPAMEAFCSTFYCFNVFSCFLSECYTQVPITYFNFFSKFSRFLSHATIRNLIHYVTRCTAPFFLSCSCTYIISNSQCT